MTSRTERLLRVFLAMSLIGSAPASAADLIESWSGPDIPVSPPRYFPRSDGGERRVRRLPAPQPIALGCIPRRVRTPTNAPDDPSYVGSAYGLSRPSYYGLTPPPGIDDPFGRTVLPYCP